ncbi:MAG: hypothetical protein MZV64_54990 [Ignavibacteriales bacterium]|nr:hypothetical protein [Ignavibacteriales bacterium]
MGNKAKLFKHSNNIFYYNDKNIFTYDYQKNKFIPSDIIKAINNDTLQSLINIYSDENNIIWSITNNQGKIQITKIDKSVNTISQNTHALLGLIDEDISSGYASLLSYVQKNNPEIIWISSGNVLIKYDLDSKLSINFPHTNKPLIRKVSLDGKKISSMDILLAPADNEEILTQISYTSNTIAFEYSLTSFLNESGNDFQFMLDGFDSNWSGWN